MSRKWMQLLVIEGVVLGALVNLLPAWNKSAPPAWEPVQWTTETTSAWQPPQLQRTQRVEARRQDVIPAPPAPHYHAPRFEGSAPLNDTQRTQYVRSRLERTRADFGAAVNQALKSSLPPEWDGESVARRPSGYYAAETWPRR